MKLSPGNSTVKTPLTELNIKAAFRIPICKIFNIYYVKVEFDKLE